MGRRLISKIRSPDAVKTLISRCDAAISTAKLGSIERISGDEIDFDRMIASFARIRDSIGERQTRLLAERLMAVVLRSPEDLIPPWDDPQPPSSFRQ
jgi:hypothetical protein